MKIDGACSALAASLERDATVHKASRSEVDFGSEPSRSAHGVLRSPAAENLKKIDEQARLTNTPTHDEPKAVPQILPRTSVDERSVACTSSMRRRVGTMGRQKVHTTVRRSTVGKLEELGEKIRTTCWRPGHRGEISVMLVAPYMMLWI